MNRKRKLLWPVIAFVVLSALQLSGLTAFAQGPGQRLPLPPIPIKGDTTHTLSKHFTMASAAKKAPDAKGFIQRWLVLEPVKKDIVRNNIFTDNYLRTTFSTDNFSSDYT
ncbi:MAG: acetylxylan esterase, partial [Pedobacter sp.]